MRFEKGTQVEVREQGESPCGSWQPERIGNRHTCGFRYYNFPQDASLFVNEVPRKVLRPCPPAVLKRARVPGDVVEIFENNSWKLAEFLGALERSVFIIRLIGSSTEIQAHSRIRIPCPWKDNSCVEFPMESAKQKNAAIKSHSRAGNLSYQIPQSCVKVQTGDDLFSAKHGVYAKQQYQFTGRMKKRQDARITPGGLPKKRKLKENEKCYKLNVQLMSTQKLEKVDAIDSPQKNYAGMYVHDGALGNGGAKLVENGLSLENQIVGIGHDIKEHLYYSGGDSTTSSVGSCSVNNGSDRSVHYNASQNKVVRGHFDDAGSFKVTSNGQILPNNSKFDLDAYHSTMRSFYESGCLSWEQESFLTNLRLSLNISNDEHLMVLKHLKKHSRG